MVEFSEAKRFVSFFFCGSCLEHLTWSGHYNAPQRGPSCAAFPSYLTTDCIFFCHSKSINNCWCRVPTIAVQGHGKALSDALKLLVKNICITQEGMQSFGPPLSKNKLAAVRHLISLGKTWGQLQAPSAFSVNPCPIGTMFPRLVLTPLLLSVPCNLCTSQGSGGLRDDTAITTLPLLNPASWTL